MLFGSLRAVRGGRGAWNGGAGAFIAPAMCSLALSSLRCARVCTRAMNLDKTEDPNAPDDVRERACAWGRGERQEG